jgi:hypothetical protein
VGRPAPYPYKVWEEKAAPVLLCSFQHRHTRYPV